MGKWQIILHEGDSKKIMLLQGSDRKIISPKIQVRVSQNILYIHSGCIQWSFQLPACSWGLCRCSWFQSWCLVFGCNAGSTGSRSPASSTWQWGSCLRSLPLYSTRIALYWWLSFCRIGHRCIDSADDAAWKWARGTPPFASPRAAQFQLLSFSDPARPKWAQWAPSRLGEAFDSSLLLAFCLCLAKNATKRSKYFPVCLTSPSQARIYDVTCGGWLKGLPSLERRHCAKLKITSL